MHSVEHCFYTFSHYVSERRAFLVLSLAVGFSGQAPCACATETVPMLDVGSDKLVNGWAKFR